MRKFAARRVCEVNAREEAFVRGTLLALEAAVCLRGDAHSRGACVAERSSSVCVLSVACTVAERARVCVSIDRHNTRARVCVCALELLSSSVLIGRWRVRRGVARALLP